MGRRKGFGVTYEVRYGMTDVARSKIKDLGRAKSEARTLFKRNGTMVCVFRIDGDGSERLVEVWKP